jgi:integrase
LRRGDFWLNGPEEPDLASALAVAIATGLRPVELADGVRLRVAGVNLLEIVIPGAKVTHDAGYAWRALVFPVGAPETDYLDQRARACDGRTYVRCPIETLRAVVKATAHRTFDRRLADAVSPYALRHLAAGRFRQTLDSAAAARALGHRSPSTTREYAKARAPGPVPERVHVPDNGAATLATDRPPG